LPREQILGATNDPLAAGRSSLYRWKTLLKEHYLRKSHLFKFALIISSLISNITPVSAADISKIRAVVQLSDPNLKVIEVGLKNIKAIVGETQKGNALIEVRVIVLGPALAFFKSKPKSALSDEARAVFEELRVNKRVGFYACENTLKSTGLTLPDLFFGFQIVHSGAYEVVRLQHEGFQYFRP
jgi:intracellular sulfur oxidation DsrE/DsrF family protein